MCEVVNENFEEIFPEITSAIQKASFIAIDTEFTGLNADSNDQSNLFDTVDKRYSKMRAHANSFIICQIGLSIYVKTKDENRYEARTYNFYICPRSQGFFEPKFLFQASAIEFLCNYKFDFNKFAYNGISYLNREEERDLHEKLKRGSFDRNSNNQEIKSCCSQVADWLSKHPKEDDELVLPVSLCIADYIIHKEIRSQFSEIWTYSSHKEVIVKKISPDKRLEIERSGSDLDEKLMNNFLGFSKVFNCLIANKKPLVGHNLLTDLILMYKQFYKPLPKKFASFKLELTSLFPKIYDTKHIAVSLSKIYNNFSGLKSSILLNLYSDLNSFNGRHYVLYSPEINHADGFLRYKSTNLLHEAGYDAYICGFVFLRMANLHFQISNSEDQQPASFNQLLTALDPYCCQVNLIRANVAYVNLIGIDPLNTRPRWLVIESKAQSSLSIKEIKETCTKFGSVDVRLINPYKALIAISSFPGARDILKEYQHDSSLTVSFYNILRHSDHIRTCLWLLATSSSIAGLGFLFLLRKRNFF